MKHCGLSLVVEIPGMEFVTGAVFLLQDTVYAKFSDYSQRAIRITHQNWPSLFGRRGYGAETAFKWVKSTLLCRPEAGNCEVPFKNSKQQRQSGKLETMA